MKRHQSRPGAAAAGWSHRHRDVSGGWLRPTVFGAVDWLVTNASLIAGVGGGGVPAHAVVLTGVAALAGALSMAPENTSRSLTGTNWCTPRSRWSAGCMPASRQRSRLSWLVISVITAHR